MREREIFQEKECPQASRTHLMRQYRACVLSVGCVARVPNPILSPTYVFYAIPILKTVDFSICLYIVAFAVHNVLGLQLHHW